MFRIQFSSPVIYHIRVGNGWSIGVRPHGLYKANPFHIPLNVDVQYSMWWKERRNIIAVLNLTLGNWSSVQYTHSYVCCFDNSFDLASALKRFHHYSNKTITIKQECLIRKYDQNLFPDPFFCIQCQYNMCICLFLKWSLLYIFIVQSPQQTEGQFLSFASS